jgi:hypothetical protein
MKPVYSYQNSEETMPYIAINTSLELDGVKRERVKAELGRLVTLIPTKTEAGLLVDFSDGRVMYRAGVEGPCAFIDVRLYGKAELEPKKRFTEETFAMLRRELGLETGRMYMSISEFESWGSAGILKSP